MKLKESIKNLLQKAGLQEDEILFYMTLLTTQGKSIYEIGKKANLSKNRAYKAFSDLYERKIVGYTGSGQFKYAFTSTLEPLTKELDRKTRQLGRTSDNLKKIEKLIPYLNSTEESTIEILEGENLIQNLYDILDEEWDTLFAYGNFDMFCENLDFEHEREFIKNRIKKGKKGIGIFSSDGAYTKDVTGRDKNELRKSVIIKDPSMLNTWCYTYDKSNVTNIWSKDEKGNFTCTRVRNKAVADFNKSVFGKLWKEYNQTI